MAGDETRNQCVVLSKIATELNLISHIGKRFRCKTVLSGYIHDLIVNANAVSGSSTPPLKQLKIHSQLLIVHKDLMIYEIAEVKQKFRDAFSATVKNMFTEHNVFDAIPNFQRFNNEVAYLYSDICLAEAEAMKQEANTLVLEEIIHKPELNQILEAACSKESLSDFLQVYKAIIKCENAVQRAENIQAAYSELKFLIANCDMGVDADIAKQKIVAKSPSQETNFDAEAVGAVKNEVCKRLHDICERLKKSLEFLKAYAKTKEFKSDLLDEILLH